MVAIGKGGRVLYALLAVDAKILFLVASPVFPSRLELGYHPVARLDSRMPAGSDDAVVRPGVCFLEGSWCGHREHWNQKMVG